MKPRTKYAQLVKKFELRDGPAGLYPSPLFWMEGSKDMEGFGAVYSFMYVKEPTTMHPVEGAIIHPYDELLVFAGMDTRDILSFDAEISIELGEEREMHVFTEPTVVLIPKGTPHGPVTVRRVGTPAIVHYSIGLGSEYRAERVDAAAAPSRGGKYGDYVRKLVSKMESRLAANPDQAGSGMGYEQVMDERGVLRPAERGIGPGNGDQIVWMYGVDLMGFDVNFTWGMYSRPGKWHVRGEVHTHPEEEILVLVGFDPDRPDYLGCEVEMGMGPEVDRYILNVPGLYIAPKGFPHLPMITRWCDVPAYGFMVVCLDGNHASPWAEVDLDAMEASGQW
ncbi:MAG: hypothetical protein LBS32_04335 [Clostridiales Family XIII bacterium]|nr:hypothetical protein [Clostridiales Family XIII bacterium]